MKIDWYTPSLGTPIVTIASYGITFNRSAIKELQEAPYVRFGYAKNEKMIVIQPLEEEEGGVSFAEKKRDRYIRINNKDLIRFITRYFDLKLDKAIRIPAYWNDDLAALIVDLNKAEIDNDDDGNE